MEKNTIHFHWKPNHGISGVGTSVDGNSGTCDTTCMMKDHFFQFSMNKNQEIGRILTWTLWDYLQGIPTIHSKHVKKIIDKVPERYLNNNQRKFIIYMQHVFTEFWSQIKCKGWSYSNNGWVTKRDCNIIKACIFVFW